MPIRMRMFTSEPAPGDFPQQRATWGTEPTVTWPPG